MLPISKNSQRRRLETCNATSGFFRSPDIQFHVGVSSYKGREKFCLIMAVAGARRIVM
jgi:hypothetical protein